MNNTNNTEAAVEILPETKAFTSECTPEELEVKVGAPCTIPGYTDRYPGTIMKVTKSYVLVRKDVAVRQDNNGMSECQDYKFQAGSNDPKDWERFNLCQDGRFRAKGDKKALTVGVRDAYHDFSF
jgi:hypothetical protein